MHGTILYGPRDIRCEEVDEPKILHPTDAIIKLSASCVCGSDLWPYRGLKPSASLCIWATNIAAWSSKWAAPSGP